MSIHRVKSPSFYAAASMTSWLCLASTAVDRAAAAVDEAAAALCRRQWQLARSAVPSEARTFAIHDRTRTPRAAGRGWAWH